MKIIWPNSSEFKTFLKRTKNNPDGSFDTDKTLLKVESMPPSKENKKSELTDLTKEVENRIVSAQYLLENNIMETPMLWGHLLQKCGIAVLSGSSDTGKSTLLRQLAISIVTKQKYFLGFPLKSKYNRVIYISSEDDEESLSPRIKKEIIKDCDKTDYDNLTYIFDGENPLEIAKKEFERKPADCIIIDTWGDYAEGDLNAANTVRTALKAIRSFALINKCLFIINHHNRKSAGENDTSKNSLLGSQSLEAKARVVLMLTVDSDDPTLRRLTVSKGNYITYELKRKSIILKTDENFIFRYLSEIENITTKGKNSEKRSKNEEGVKLLLSKGKKPLEIIAEISSIVEEPYGKTAIRDIIKKVKKDNIKQKDDEESVSVLL